MRDPQDRKDPLLKAALRRQALAEGFSCVGFAPPQPPPHAAHLSRWLQQKAHGDMTWMAKQPERRADPRALMPNLGSIMVLGINHRPPGGGSSVAHLDPAHANMAAYACHTDYHDVIKKRLKRLAGWLTRRLRAPIDGRLFVDTAPLLEKPLATAAGLGWQGKNSLLVSPHFGCWLFLAEYLLPLALPPDLPMRDQCGTCTRCLTACPTDALRHPYRLNASRCLAYLTVESAGPIPTRYRTAMGNRVYGCDACVTACPWNRFAPTTAEADFLPRAALSAPPLLALYPLDDPGFRALTRHTPIKRSGIVRFLRNLAIALGNWGAPEAMPVLQHLLGHASPLVRGHAAWGMGRLLVQHAGTPFGETPAVQLATRRAAERDATVQHELDAALRMIRR